MGQGEMGDSDRSSVRARLGAALSQATKTEKAIASYMLANLNGLPFETAATLAEKVGVSEPSVGRFCRAIGYRHFKALKKPLFSGLPGLKKRVPSK